MSKLGAKKAREKKQRDAAHVRLVSSAMRTSADIETIRIAQALSAPPKPRVPWWAHTAKWFCYGAIISLGVLLGWAVVFHWIASR